VEARRADTRRILIGRTARGFADGFVSVLLAQYLTGLGFSPTQVGAIVTATLVGSAALTLLFGLRAHRHALRTLLLVAAALMVATGIGFAGLTWFVPLLIVAFLGTLNPSSGDVSAFLPTEQAVLATLTEPRRRTHLFARYNLAGIWAGAVGALVSGVPVGMATRRGWDPVTTQRLAFAAYAVIGVGVLALYWRLRTHAEAPPRSIDKPRTLRHSRRIVLELSAMFSLDSAGSGFVVTSLLVLWLHLRFDLSAGSTATIFFVAGLLGGCSQLLAPWLARRIGLVRTMAYTHIPANLLLILAAFAPTAPVAVGLLLTRALFAQMDVPARQALVMVVVPATERAAASSLTNVPRSLAAATTPLLAGILLSHSTFGWPLVIAGTTKLVYDIGMLVLYRDLSESTVDERRSPSRW
jgi:MFS family permease